MPDEKIIPIVGQCGTCKFAACFDYADSPSGPEDGVHCTSEAQAQMMYDQTHGDFDCRQELKEYGFMDLWRLENLADEDYHCPNWAPKEGKYCRQLMPAEDEAPLTVCPHCGAEYNIKTDDGDKLYEHLAGDFFLHKACGKVVKFQGGFSEDEPWITASV